MADRQITEEEFAVALWGHLPSFTDDDSEDDEIASVKAGVAGALAHLGTTWADLTSRANDDTSEEA